MKSLRQSSIWRATKKYAFDPIRRTYFKTAYSKYVPLSWFPASNWGDALSPVLVRMISGKPVKLTQASYCDRYMAIGSILSGADSRTEVWGTGFMQEGETVQEPPKKIHAVRGPLTRTALLREKILCPEVYGDPALLLPRFYNPEVVKQYEIGIIPHYVDKSHPWIQRHRVSPGICVIDVLGNLWEFVRAVKSCKVVLSSSLHGLICSDAYGIPNAWIQLSNQVIGGEFKFNDYHLSIGAGSPPAIPISEDTPIDAVARAAQHHVLHIDLVRLIQACPFLNGNIPVKNNHLLTML